MRNLDILTKFSNLLRDLNGALVEMACLDEFGHTLYVFTRGEAKLRVYKYGQSEKGGE